MCSVWMLLVPVVCTCVMGAHTCMECCVCACVPHVCMCVCLTQVPAFARHLQEDTMLALKDRRAARALCTPQPGRG